MRLSPSFKNTQLRSTNHTTHTHTHTHTATTMFPVQNYEDMEGDERGLRMDERPRRKGATRGWADREEHDFGSTTDRFFRREKRGGDDDSALRRARTEKEDLRTGLFGRGKAARQQDEAHSRAFESLLEMNKMNKMTNACVHVRV
jgi:hypothetical protein